MRIYFTLIMDNKQILSSRYNFYAFFFSITSVLVCIYMYRDDIEKFEEDTVVKDTVVKDTVVKDTVVQDTVVQDTVAIENNMQEISENLRFTKPDLVDEFASKFNKDGSLLFYISSFQKNMVDFDKNLMLNHVQLPDISSDRNVMNLNEFCLCNNYIQLYIVSIEPHSYCKHYC